MTQGPQWARIPLELRQRAQWLVAGPDKAPLGITQHGTTYNGSVTDPATWVSFETAARYAFEHGLHIGYVLTAADPFACIDLDVCDAESQQRKGKPVDPAEWTTMADFNRYWTITQAVNSYTERSTYGKGLHIWVRGKIGKGLKRDGIEVYSQERFIVTTGDTVLPVGMEDRQSLLTQMVEDMRAKDAPRIDLVEQEEEESDTEIIERAINAGNGAKFNDLCAGRWDQYGFPSQSEADLALMSMFTFYSKSNEQCRRLFRMTALGKREKAVKDNRYIDLTLKLVRARQAREASVDVSALAVAAEYVMELNAQKVARQASPLTVVGNGDKVMQQPAPAAAALAAPVPHTVTEAAQTGLQWPPGLAGAIAQFIYQSAPRPVKEVAIVGALGFLAGVCGKAWFIPQSGLNIYVILVARSAVGKEAMHSGISALIKATSSRSPSVYEFVNFGDFASGPALVKQCAANSSFVNVAGEWGRKLKAIAQDDGRNTAMASLRTVMTNLYQKSGPASIVGGINYSNKDNNIDSVSGVSFSMIGETTPGTFYEALTEQMMEDGFLSRFTVVEYDGDRPPLNTNQVLEPSKALGDAVGDLCQHARGIIGNTGALSAKTPVPLGRTDAAAQLMWSFEKECDKEINSTNDEAWRQMWNRASLKVMRIAGLLAVADNWMFPVIDIPHVDWAMDLIRRDIGIMRRKIEAGDIGMGDHSRERKVAAMIAEYLRDGAPAGYKIPVAMKENAIIPRKYLQIRLARVTSFSSHKMGSNAALDFTLKAMVETGYLMEVAKDSMVQGYNFHGRCYRVLGAPPDTDKKS